MRTINFTLDSRLSQQEIVERINTLISSSPEVSTLLKNYHWDDTTLYAEGPFGKGTIDVHIGNIRINITLTLLGSAAATTIERKLRAGLEPILKH